MNRYYVYIHRRGDGRVVYVGKGTGARATTFCNRDHALHHRWMRRLINSGQYGFIEYDSYYLSEQEALDREQELIFHHESILGDKLFNNHFSKYRGSHGNRFL